MKRKRQTNVLCDGGLKFSAKVRQVRLLELVGGPKLVALIVFMLFVPGVMEEEFVPTLAVLGWSEGLGLGLVALILVFSSAPDRVGADVHSYKHVVSSIVVPQTLCFNECVSTFST